MVDLTPYDYGWLGKSILSSEILKLYLMAEENFKMFKDVWEEEIKKIENGVIDNRGSLHIYDCFSLCKNFLIQSLKTRFELTPNFNLEIELLKTRLTIALEIAHTKNMLQNRSLLVKIIESISRAVQKVPKP